MKCLACDLGGSSVKYGLVDDNALITESGKVPAPLDSKEQFVETIGGLYDCFKDRIDGIAISIPGYIDPQTGYLFGSGVYKPLYYHYIPQILKGRCPVPVYVENDGKCGALSEAWQGSLFDCSDGAVIILGSGIAGGIIKDHKIHSGKGFTAGEFSYALTVQGDVSMLGCAFMNSAMLGMTYKMCKLKNLDYSVQDSSAAFPMFDEALPGRYPQLEGTPKKIKCDGKQLFKWLAEWDSDAKKVYDEFIHSLAVLVYNVQICFAPEKIVIGGGLSTPDCVVPDVIEALNSYYAALSTSEQMRSTVVRSRYLDECNLVGAAYNYILRSESR